MPNQSESKWDPAGMRQNDLAETGGSKIKEKSMRNRGISVPFLEYWG